METTASAARAQEVGDPQGFEETKGQEEEKEEEDLPPKLQRALLKEAACRKSTCDVQVALAEKDEELSKAKAAGESTLDLQAQVLVLTRGLASAAVALDKAEEARGVEQAKYEANKEEKKERESQRKPTAAPPPIDNAPREEGKWCCLVMFSDV